MYHFKHVASQKYPYFWQSWIQTEDDCFSVNRNKISHHSEWADVSVYKLQQLNASIVLPSSVAWYALFITSRLSQDICHFCISKFVSWMLLKEGEQCNTRNTLPKCHWHIQNWSPDVCPLQIHQILHKQSICFLFQHMSRSIICLHNPHPSWSTQHRTFNDDLDAASYLQSTFSRPPCPEAGVITSCIYKPNSQFEAFLSAGLYDNIKHKEAKQKMHCNDSLLQGLG